MKRIVKSGGILTLAAIALAALSTRVDGREVHYAAEDAAYQIVKQMAAAEMPVRRLAFLGLFGPRQEVVGTVRAGLVGTPGAFEFYTRNEAVWDELVREIEFGERRADIMTPETIQKFGRVSGVQALVFGDILEATRDADGGVVRLRVIIGEVETGRILWSANIEGRYELPPPVEPLSERQREAARAAADELVEKLVGNLENQMQGKNIDRCDVYVLPMAGPGGGQLDEIVLDRLSGRLPGGVRLFARPAGERDQRNMRRLADDLLAEPPPAQRARIGSQLQQVFEGAEAATVDGILKAALTGRVESLHEASRESKVDLSARITTVGDNELLAAATAVGLRRITPGEEIEGRVEGWIEQLTLKHILIGLAVFLGLILLVAFVRGMRRPR